MARRLRILHEPIVRGGLTLRGDAFAYAAVVHRARVGHEVEVFDGKGLRGCGHFTAFEADGAHVSIDRVEEDTRPLRRVTLVQGLAKGDKIEESLRDACELGLAELVVAEAARSVRKLDEAGRAKLVARLERIAAEAARQALAAHVAVIAGVVPVEEAFAGARAATRLLLDPSGATPLFEALREAPPSEDLALAVGPEGGFTSDEVVRARACGWRTIRLGTTVLRTETMAAAALGAVRAFDDADDRARDPLAGEDEDRSP